MNQSEDGKDGTPAGSSEDELDGGSDREDPLVADECRVKYYASADKKFSHRCLQFEPRKRIFIFSSAILTEKQA